MILLKPYISFAIFAVLVFLFMLMDIDLTWRQFFYPLSAFSFILLAAYHYFKKIKGTIVLKRKKRILKSHEVLVGLVLLLLSWFRISDHNSSLLIWYCAIYFNIWWNDYQIKPAVAGISGTTLLFRDFVLKKNEVSGIQRIIYYETEQKISIEFIEGTNNIDFYCKEYEFSELISFVKYVAAMPENKPIVSDILTNYYFTKEN